MPLEPFSPAETGYTFGVERAWKRYRPVVEANWLSYLRGEISHTVAIERTVAALQE